MEETHVYNIFESMMGELMIETPDDPIPFLISKLNPDDKTKDGSIGLQSKGELPQQSRILILGPPKCHSKEFTLMLSEHFKYQSVSIGDLLKKEVKKKSDIGKGIQDSMRENSYAEDQIAIDLIEKQLQQFDSNKQSWIIEGFPGTGKQALELLKHKNFILNKIVFIEVDDDLTIQRIKEAQEEELGDLYND